MSFGLYVLDDDGKPRLLCSRPSDREGLLHWAAWVTKNRERMRVALDVCGDAEVSTVFLGINLGVREALRPLVFETEVWRDGTMHVAGRTGTLEQARTLHKRVLQSLKAAQHDGPSTAPHSSE